VTLAETQALFHGLVTGGTPLDAPDLERCLAGTHDLPAADRVAIYRDMYASRLVEALRETFPNLARFLGEERFSALAVAYVHEHPSEHHDVGRIGKRLPEFLRAFPDPERPDLADLAALEWERNEVFFAPQSETAGAEALASAGPEARLVLVAALRVVEGEHDASAPWRRLEAGEPVDPPVARPTVIAVWRRGFDVFHCALGVEEASALRAAQEGETLEVICGCFDEAPDPAAAAYAAISSWFGEAWISGATLPGPGPSRAPSRERNRPEAGA
jgi:hypothetical protein